MLNSTTIDQLLIGCFFLFLVGAGLWIVGKLLIAFSGEGR